MLTSAGSTKFGRVHVAEPAENLPRMHFAATSHHPLRPVAWPPRVPVLDQEDLTAQGIDTADLVKGAKKVTALGSCVANASTAALSAGPPLAVTNAKLAATGRPQLSGTDAAVSESFAIILYHLLTDSTGDPAAEWPPADVGSSGAAACKVLHAQGLVTGHKIAHGAENILSLMMTGGLITGQPWFNKWMVPTSNHFIDGDGGPDSLQDAINSGVAGGHETYWYGVEEIGYDLAGGIDPLTTIIRFRNSWSSAWGDQGDGLAHLSTFISLGAYCDFRQFTW